MCQARFISFPWGMMLMMTSLCRCRGVIEFNISEVAHGRRAKEAVLEEAVQHFRNDYISAAQKQGMPVSSARTQLMLFFQPSPHLQVAVWCNCQTWQRNDLYLPYKPG